MTHIPRKRTAGAVAATAAAAVALTAGLAAPAAGQDARGDAGAGARSEARADGQRQITLITGDRVVVDEAGEVTGLVRAEGREDIPVQVLQQDGATYAIPADARRLLADGVVDRRLFNVTELSREQYDTATAVPVIVTYEEGADGRDARAELFAGEEAGAPDVTATLESINGEAMDVAPADAAATWQALTAPTRGASALTAAPGVATIVLDAVVRTTLAESVPQVGAPEAWEAGYDGTGTTVAVLDTGITADHADVSDKIVAAENFTPTDGTGDAFGHGTHVASIAAGTGAHSDGTFTGVAPGADLLNGKVLDDDGFGETSWVLAGMEWAVEQEADVINMSLGDYASSELDPMEEAVNTLSAESDSLFVVSAGNEGEFGDETIGTPGTADAALTVGAVDKSDVLAPFSSTGPRLRDGAVKPDITAPGVAIGAAASPGSLIEAEGTPVADGYVAIDGTSMSAPHVAGAAALLAQAHPEWTGEDLKAALTSSALPSDLTPFQEGTGRLDVPAALGQTVVAEANGLNFGLAEWPHEDDTPVTRELTYRNLGEEDVTLDVAAEGTGPDGEAAPAGLFTLAQEQVTVPAGGSATVEVTADTSVPAPDGHYSLDVVATGDAGQTVRAVGGVEREVESYELNVEAIDREGAPAGEWYGYLTDPATFETFELPADPEATVRIPAGDYTLDASFVRFDASGENVLSADVLFQPRLTVGEDAALTLDARDAEPIDVTVDDAEAERFDASLSYDLLSEDGESGLGTVFFGGALPEGLHTAQLGEVGDGWQLSSTASTIWVNGDREYYTVNARDGSFYTGLSEHVTEADLARVTVGQGASLPDRLGALYVYAEVSGMAVGTDRPLPRTTEILVQGGPSDWGMDLWQVDTAVGIDEAFYFSDYTTYEPGQAYEETFNVGVFGPRIGEFDGLFREGDTLYGYVNPLSDGAGHYGDSVVTTVSTTLYRDGEELATGDNVIDWEEFELPAEEGDYELVTTLTRDGIAASVSTEVTASYTFTSARPADGEVASLPASAVRFTPELALDSTSPAGETVSVPVTVQGSGAAEGSQVVVSVSTDGGGTWEAAEVVDGALTVENPEAGGSVSFRAEVTDPEGNVTTQTIVDAYRTA
ncbi:S8 family peptidase [Streptomyces sp. 4N509B]|uniref:S8 family peptidase n=1 Tax=Streptomyces sp. 4N509B TaxID=3457413 RepID=UPI003FD0320D